MWYFYQYMEDQDEQFNTGRDLVEYNASFIEPEAVRKIREARDNSVNVPDEDFVAGIEHVFGRKINLPDDKKSTGEVIGIDVETAMRKAERYSKTQNSNKKKANTIDYTHWLGIDLE